MTTKILRGGVDWAPEASPWFRTRFTTAHCLAVPGLEIHDLPKMESLLPAKVSSRRRAAWFNCRIRASKRQPRSRWSEMAPLLGSIFAPLTSLISGELNLFHSLGAPWWLAIVLLTLSVRAALFPLTLRQVRSTRAMQEIRPELERIRSKYRDDRQKQQQKLAELYKERHINPLGGFLPLLIQMPIFITLYYTVRSFESHVPASSMAACCGSPT
jgi:membrane protein insertase Oxa1/YidC/SpoIIIJ